MKKTIKKLIIILIIIVVIALAALLIINSIVKSAADGRLLTVEDAASLNADCILVLGAGVYSSGQPSPMLNDRLEYGISLYEVGAAEKLLMSGDHGRKEYDEVNVMKDFAIDSGIPSEDVFMDHAGFSTYESLYRARDIFEAETVIIVTQEYHMYRTLYIADKLGLDAYGVCSDPREYAVQWYRDLREIAARTKDFVQCIFMPEPTFLGEAMPVSGDGDVTNDK
ncbi:MAG: SanA protein [Ruminococcaceae bacterium]|nr:SanA protein [Oscillospiraceae bacterium]